MENNKEEKIRDLINKYMDFKCGLETSSIDHYAEYGKVSGSLFLNVKNMLLDFEKQQTEELNNRNKELSDALEKFTVLNTEHYKDIAGLIINAREKLNKTFFK